MSHQSIIDDWFAKPLLERLRIQHEQCRKAFFQDPTPRLGSALKQLEASIKYEERLLRKKGKA